MSANNSANSSSPPTSPTNPPVEPNAPTSNHGHYLDYPPHGSPYLNYGHGPQMILFPAGPNRGSFQLNSWPPPISSDSGGMMPMSVRHSLDENQFGNLPTSEQDYANTHLPGFGHVSGGSRPFVGLPIFGGDARPHYPFPPHHMHEMSQPLNGDPNRFPNARPNQTPVPPLNVQVQMPSHSDHDHVGGEAPSHKSRWSVSETATQDQAGYSDSDELPDSARSNNSNKQRHWGTGRKKIDIKLIPHKLKRQITFSKRKTGLLKKVKELTTLTNTEALLVLVSETGNPHKFATAKFKSLIDSDNSEINNILRGPPDYVPQIKARR